MTKYLQRTTKFVIFLLKLIRYSTLNTYPVSSATISKHNLSPQTGHVTVEDQSNQKGVTLTTYYKYFKTGGGYLLTIFVFAFFFAVEVETMSREHMT